MACWWCLEMAQVYWRCSEFAYTMELATRWGCSLQCQTVWLWGRHWETESA